MHTSALSLKWNVNNPLRWRHNGRDGFSNHQPRHCLLNRLFRRRSKETSKLRVTGLCVWNSPGTGEFPAQMASNAENVSIWWRHHAYATHWQMRTNPHMYTNTINLETNHNGVVMNWLNAFFGEHACPCNICCKSRVPTKTRFYQWLWRRLQMSSYVCVSMIPVCYRSHLAWAIQHSVVNNMLLVHL